MAWGFIELQPGQMKLAKNTQRMHMVFHVQNGSVEARVYESVFTVHRGGVWQVPRGKFSLSGFISPSDPSTRHTLCSVRRQSLYALRPCLSDNAHGNMHIPPS